MLLSIFRLSLSLRLCAVSKSGRTWKLLAAWVDDPMKTGSEHLRSGPFHVRLLSRSVGVFAWQNDCKWAIVKFSESDHVLPKPARKRNPAEV